MKLNKEPAPALPEWLSKELPFERYSLKINDYKIHVMEQGGTGQPVLLLHGNPTWGFLYRKVAKELKGSGMRLIMPDLLGLGLSSKPRDPGVHQLQNHANIIRQVIEALDLPPLIFVGQDWGGPIGLLALAQRPEKAAGMVILNTVLGPPKPGFKPTLFHRFAKAPLISSLFFRLLSFPQAVLHSAQGDRASIRGEVARAYKWPLSGLKNNVAPLALARMVPAALDHPSVEPLARCQAFVERYCEDDKPRAIVWGEKDPVLGKLLRRNRRIMKEPPTTMTQAGHFLQEEVPGPIADAIIEVRKKL
jgi:cis-3-alkyl-4-acyloxetan-2-one decarboxylase